MTADDATAGPSSAPLAAPAPTKPSSPNKAVGPRDKENTPDATPKSIQGNAASASQRSGGHTRTPSGQDAMTRDMGNLQMAPASRQAYFDPDSSMQSASDTEQHIWLQLS